MNYRKEKSDRYVLQNQNPYWWANIVISDDGYLDIQSDYGDYAYRWNSFGPSFKKFLLDIDDNYLCGKLSIGRNFKTEIDSEKTVELIKRRIIELRRDHTLSAEDARGCWDETDDILGLSDLDQLYSYMNDGSVYIIHYLYDYNYSEIDYKSQKNTQLRIFLEVIWSEFKHILHDELYG